MKKMLFAVSALVVFSLFADPVFELKFDGNKSNWDRNFRNYQAKFTNKPAAGAEMASVAVTAKPDVKNGVDTAFAFVTPLFSVEGKKTVKVEAEIYSTADLNVIWGNSYRPAVVWFKDKASAPKDLLYDSKLKMKLTDFSIKGPKGTWQKIERKISVPAGMGAAFVQIGFDSPNLVGKDFFAVKSFKVTAE